MQFPTEVCHACPVRAKCTTATRHGRQLPLRPQPVQQALDAARVEQTTHGWQRDYALRAGVESTIAQATKVTNARRASYRGLDKTRLQHHHGHRPQPHPPRCLERYSERLMPTLGRFRGW